MSFQFGLVGFPIKHSLSPWIHQQFMESTDVKGTYELFEIKPEQFDEQMRFLRSNNIDGFNITVPYKQKIIPYLDEIDKDAQRVGAVNTVVNRNGRWIGFNTDGMGYVRSLQDAFPSLFHLDKKVLLLGAGGAARGIYRSLVVEGFHYIDLANRTTEKAESLLPLKEDYVKTNVLSIKEAEERLERYDLVIQTTSVGMKPEKNSQIISLKGLGPETVVSDIVYQPIKTQLLAQAEGLGGFVHFGHAMLLYQAQYAFEIWTGKLSPINDTLIKLEERLRGM